MTGTRRRWWLSFRRRTGYPLEDVAAVAQRLAVLLGAGVSPASAWQHLAAAGTTGDAAGTTADAAGRSPTRPFGRGVARGAHGHIPSTSELVTRVADAAARASPVAEALHEAARSCPAGTRAAWDGLAAAWAVATDAGAPLARNLNDLAESLRSVAQIERDLAVALAGPTATARTVLVLPLVGVLFGAVLGFDTVRTLFATPPGIACLVVGAVLVAAARAWNHRLIRSASPTAVAPGLTLDLLAIALSGGSSVAKARASVTAATGRFLPGGAADERGIDAVLDLAVRSGVPAAGLLRGEAEQLRREARSEGRQRAETASAALMLPLGICVLPAFLAVGVVPLLLSVISSTGFAR